jgi:hypothetical protein
MLFNRYHDDFWRVVMLIDGVGTVGVTRISGSARAKLEGRSRSTVSKSLGPLPRFQVFS